MFNLTTFDKAITAGIISALTALVARYGWQPSGEAVNATSVLITLLVSYTVGHLAVYWKANKPKL